MKISDFLFADDAMVELRAADKEGLLRALAQHAASRLKAPHETFLAELMKREALGSTGLGGGVAIPHARFDVVMQPFAVLAKLKQPIDFNAIDDQPVDLVLLLLLPARSQGDQLGALACAARKLPAVFCVQNNQTALSTPARENSAVRVFADKGLGYGIPSVTVDGTDPEAIAAARDLRQANPSAMYEIRPVKLYRPGVAFPLTEA